MTEYSNVNSGALFTNSRKEKDTHPDYNGSLNVNGVDYWISGWKKKDRNDNTFLSLSVKPKDQQQAPAPRQAPPAQRPAPSHGQRPAPRGNGGGGGFNDGFSDMESDPPF